MSHYRLGNDPETFIFAIGFIIYWLWGLVTGRITTRNNLTYERTKHTGTGARLLGVFLIGVGSAIIWWFFGRTHTMPHFSG